MTQIRPLTQPVRRRPGELGVHSLDRFNFSVPDLAQAQTFYSSFGLEVKEEDGALDIHTHGHPHCWGSVVEGPRKKLQFISFGAFEDDLPRFRERLDPLRDRAHRSAARRRSRTASGFAIPTARRSRSVSPRNRSPNEKSSFENISSPPGVAGAPSSSTKPFVQPRRLAHMLVFTRDIPQTIKFYGEVLGLRLSDRSGDMIAFMHGIHGSDHHMIAFVKSDGPGLHHLSWDVPSINDIGLGAMHMADKGFTRRLGARPPRARLELFPLRARSLGQLRRIFIRHRLHPGRSRLEERRSSAGGFVLRLGSRAAADFAFNHEAAA